MSVLGRNEQAVVLNSALKQAQFACFRTINFDLRFDFHRV
jgi:hypothetical protein